jgi:hypothetical protein
MPVVMAGLFITSRVYLPATQICAYRKYLPCRTNLPCRDLLALNEWIAGRVGSKIRQRRDRHFAEEEGMSRKIPLIAASLIGLTLPVLSPAPTQAIPGSGAFTPVADTAFVPVADVAVAPAAEWRRGHRRWARARRPSRPYYEPYAYEPAYRYGGNAPYDCCEVYAVYPAYDRPYSYSYLGRYYYAEGPRYYLPGFHGSPASYYYW